MIMSWFRALIILIRVGPFITTNANELTMFANQPLRNGHPTLHIAITPNGPLDAGSLFFQWFYYNFIFCDKNVDIKFSGQDTLNPGSTGFYFHFLATLPIKRTFGICFKSWSNAFFSMVLIWLTGRSCFFSRFIFCKSG